MTKLFTVKIDLSEVVQNDTGRKIYISLVDQNKMKRVVDFKNWIRFLFTIQKPIDILYEDAVIHDLEDSTILSLLKVVRIKESSANEVHHEALLQRLDEDNKCQNETPPKTMTLMCNLKDHQSKQSQDCNIFESQQCIDWIDNNKHDGPTTMNHSSHNARGEISESWNESRSAREPLTSVEVIDPQKKVSTVLASNQITNTNTLYNDRKKEKDLLQHSNVSVSQNNGMSTNSKKIDETDSVKSNEVKTNFKGRAYHRPFTIFETLNALRSENDKDDKKADLLTATSIESCGMSGMSIEDNFTFDDACVNQAKKRKRIRKHKSKRKKVDGEINNSVSTPNTSYNSFSNDSALYTSPQDVKPKHIRFETDDVETAQMLSNEFDGLQSRNSINQLPCHQDGENLNIETKHDIVEQQITDECPQFLDSSQNEKCSNNSHDEGTAVVDGVGKKHEVSASGLGDVSPLTILDALGSLRKQFASPLVVSRFN